MKKENSFNRILLFFFDKETEKEFIKHYAARSVIIVRIGFLLGSITFIAIGLLVDKRFFPDNPFVLAGWRISGAIITLSAAIFVSTIFFQNNFQKLILLAVTALGFIVLNLAITYNKAGFYNYSLSIAAFIVFVYALTSIRFIYSVILTWSVIITYAVWVSNLIPPEGILTQNVVFFAVINLFGMIAAYGNERNIRDAFIKSRQLKISRRLLAEEHKRTSYELASVKELQLSMLPEKTPSHEAFDIAFHMSTATEVGGDYCDYLNGHDNSLTFAIGDATGHGARASTMVMAVKMLFVEYATRKTVSGFLRHVSATIRSMKLPKLYMTLAFGRIQGHKMEISGAGLPPALLYKSDKEIIEQISLKGIPLGTFASNNYEEKEIMLSFGDIIVLMTDGVVELFNSNGEMYGTKLIEEQIKQYASCSAQEIVNHLVREADNWRGEEPLHDDMTLLVLKIKLKLPDITKEDSYII